MASSNMVTIATHRIFEDVKVVSGLLAGLPGKAGVDKLCMLACEAKVVVPFVLKKNLKKKVIQLPQPKCHSFFFFFLIRFRFNAQNFGILILFQTPRIL